MVKETTDWVVFRYKGREIGRISVEGIHGKEVLATKELLALNYGLEPKDISAKLVREIPLRG